MKIAVCNQKGGVGKTTTAVNLAMYLALFGKKVLLIDVDPQAGATVSLGIDYRDLDKTIYDVFVGSASIDEVTIKGMSWDDKSAENLHVAPSSLDLAGAEVELINQIGREKVLHKAIKDIANDYDYIIVDCPPNLGIFTINAIIACQNILVPIQAQYLPLEGLGQLHKVCNLIEDRMEIPIRLRYLITMADNTKLCREVEEEVRKTLGDSVFRTVIPKNVRLAEAPSHGKPIAIYDPECKGAKAYEKLTKEVISLEEW